jgi:hypothetical protein
MKDKLKQIEFVDKTLLPIYGFKSIQDYTTKISSNDIKKSTSIILNLNNILSELKQVFQVKEFNLHKTDGKIQSHTQAFALLKKCLQICNILFDIIQENKINYLRLIQKNNILDNYIDKNKMTDILGNLNYDTPKKLHEIKYDELVIKEEIMHDYYFPLYKKDFPHIKLNIRDILDNTNKVLVEFTTNDTTLLEMNILDKLYDCEYFIDAHGIIIYKSTLKKNHNIFPDVIIPFKCLKYTTICLNIYCPQLKYINSDLDIKISVNKVLFKKKVNDKLFNVQTPFFINIPFNNRTLCFKNNSINIIPELLQPQIDINGNISNIGKYSLFTFNGENGTTTNLIYYLVFSKCNLAQQRVYNIPFECSYYTLSDSKYIFKHLLIRNYDLIYDIVINFPEPIQNIEKIYMTTIKISGQSNNTIFEPPLLHYFSNDSNDQMNYILENKNKCLKLNYKKDYMISLLNGTTYLNFEIGINNNISNILKNTVLSYNGVLSDMSIRKNLFESYEFSLL